jgi:hypothetical protein
VPIPLIKSFTDVNAVVSLLRIHFTVSVGYQLHEFSTIAIPAVAILTGVLLTAGSGGKGEQKRK